MASTTLGSHPLERSVVQPRADDRTAEDMSLSAGRSAASWPAIFAGAFVAVSASVILIMLGSGFGFAELSPWPHRGVSATTFTVTAAIWFVVTQWLSSALGGYIAGRLRTRWVGTHTHEVFFRDTAHGLITWSVATVVAAVVVTSALSSAIGGGARAVSQAAGSGAAALGAGAPGGAPASLTDGFGPSPAMTYGMDRLFRPASGAAAGNSRDLGDPRVEAAHIVANALATGGKVPDADRAYLADLVASRTGISGAEAQRRVDDFIASATQAEDQVRAAADAARKSAAETSIYTALAMLVGAFIASVSAALGGRLRDQHP
jgi:hypothetical protein